MLRQSERWMKWMAAGVLGLAMATPAISWAQPGDGPGQGRQREERRRDNRGPRDGDGPQREQGTPVLDRLRDATMKLDLNEEQKGKLSAIFEKAGAELKAMRDQWEKNRTEPEQRRDETRAFAEKLRQQVREVLTEEQNQALQKQMRQEMRERGPGGSPEQMIQRMRKALEQVKLSDDQKQQVKAVVEEVAGKLREIAKQREEHPQDAREAARKVLDEARDQINEILTPDQRAQLREQMRDQRPEERPRDGARGPRNRGPAND